MGTGILRRQHDQGNGPDPGPGPGAAARARVGLRRRRPRREAEEDPIARRLAAWTDLDDDQRQAEEMYLLAEQERFERMHERWQARQGRGGTTA
jgi:hypothetical protein